MFQSVLVGLVEVEQRLAEVVQVLVGRLGGRLQQQLVEEAVDALAVAGRQVGRRRRKHHLPQRVKLEDREEEKKKVEVAISNSNGY